MKSREIKFRAWVKAEKRMCPITVLTDEGAYLVGVSKGKDQYYDGGREVIRAPDDGRFLNKREFVLMQFTGLQDKNGKDIYEGDIVENKTQRKNFDNRTGKYEYHLDVITTRDVVEFNKHWCSFDFTKRTEIGELKVLGNIYQTPELMTNC